MKYQITFFILCGALLIACDGNNKGSDSSELNSLLMEETEKPEIEVSEEMINSVIQSLPSPLEITTLIRESGLSYNYDFLVPVEQAKYVSTDEEKALVMGIYSGDLGYINIYEKARYAIDYLGTVKKLANDLMIGQFFDIETLKRIASNSKKIDSLLYISTISFERMDRFLRDQKRSKLSVLMVTGAWIESVYLATQVVNSLKNDALIERIAEQKMILDQLILILAVYDNDDYVKDITDRLIELKEEYDEVTIEYTYKEPKTEVINGDLVIIDNSTTEVKISDDQLQRIIRLVKEIRSYVTSFQ